MMIDSIYSLNKFDLLTAKKSFWNCSPLKRFTNLSSTSISSNLISIRQLRTGGLRSS